MPNAVQEASFTDAAFETFLGQRREPSWLTDMRRDAWDVFTRLGMPERGSEEWARTDLRAFHLDRFALPVSATSSEHVPQGLLNIGVDLAGRDITLDSRPIESHLDPVLTRKGVLFGSLDQAVEQYGDRLRPWLLSRLVEPQADKFAALHAACWSGGTLLYVPRGVVIDRPLHMLSGLTPGGADFGHALIVLEEGAEATVMAETASDATAAGLHCGAIEIFVGPRARLRYVNLQNWGSGVWHFAHQKAMIDRDGSLQWTIGALGARLAKVNQHVALCGEGAETQVNGVMFTEGKQHLAYHTRQDHHAPNCRSNLLYKGALQDKSRIVWRGMIRVDQDAQKTDGYQRNDNLMLSDTARADSIPGLEILADDVRCSHGSTIGRVEEELMFYACSRGLTRREAARMIVSGFFQQVLDRITIDGVREALGEVIGRRVREY